MKSFCKTRCLNLVAPARVRPGISGSGQCRTAKKSRWHRCPQVRILRPVLLLPLFAPGAELFAEPAIEEEIVVTAVFRDTSLMDSAGSATVLAAGMAADRGALHLEEILGIAPNIGWSSGASRSRFLQVRGIGDLERYAEPKYYPAVGLIVDDLEIGDAANAATLFDAAQVEILRGPQGTRFGASAHAGVVNIRTNEPTDEFEGALSAGAGNYDAYNIGGILSGPLSATLKGRVAVQQSASDGYFKNAALGRDDLAGFDELTVRTKLQWHPNDRSRYGLNLLAFEGDNGYDLWSLDNNRTTQADQPGVDRQEVRAATLAGDWQLDGGTAIRLRASHAGTDLLYSYDADWISPEFCIRFTCSYGHDTAAESFARNHDQTTFDARLLGGDQALAVGDFRYVAGVYAKTTDERLDYAYPSLWYGDYSVTTHYDTTRAAAYGELEYAAGDSVSLSLSGRIEAFEDDYEDSNGVSHGNSESLLNLELTGKLRLENGALLYATLAVAEKPGGVNVGASSQLGLMSPTFRGFMAPKLRFGSETLINKEIGYKTVAAHGRVAVRLAAFHTHRSNAQLESWMWDDAAGLWIGYLDSTSDATNYGLELESVVDVTATLRVFANLALLRTEVDELATFDLDVFDFVSRDGRDQAKSPRYQYAAGLNLELPGNLSASVGVQGRGDSFYGYYHDGKLAGYDIVNANLRWTVDRFSINLWVRNLTDREYATHGLYFGADPRDDFAFWANRTYEQLGAPRTFGFNARYLF